MGGGQFRRHPVGQRRRRRANKMRGGDDQQTDHDKWRRRLDGDNDHPNDGTARRRHPPGLPAGQIAGTDLSVGLGENPLLPLRFSVDERTNSIVASGTEADLRVVEAILLRLDEDDVRQRQSVVFRLRNAPALDVANSIDTFLLRQQEINQLTVEYQAISPFEQIASNVIVVPELVSNSLIISATPRYFDNVMKVVRDLDFRKPMVRFCGQDRSESHQVQDFPVFNGKYSTTCYIDETLHALHDMYEKRGLNPAEYEALYTEPATLAA